MNKYSFQKSEINSFYYRKICVSSVNVLADRCFGGGGNAMRVRWLFSYWCLNNLFLNSLLHRILFLPSNLFPSNDAGLYQKKNAGNIVEDSTNKRQAKGPGKVIVFPVRHEVATVSEGTKNDERNCTKCTWKNIYISIWVTLFCMHQVLLNNISKVIAETV